MNTKNSKNLKFSNDFGTITSEEIRIHNHNRKTPIRLQYIRKIQLVKRRKLHNNVFFFGVSLFVFWTMACNNIFLINQAILFVLGITILVLSIFHTSFELEFVILMKFDFVTLKVKGALEDDTNKFISAFNKYRDNLVD